MNFVKLVLSSYGSYHYNDASNIEMNILGNFLTDDVGCMGSSFKEFAFNEWETETASNITSLRKEHGKIFLSDLYSEEDLPTELAMTLSQYVQLLDDWENKICKKRPQEVVIKRENDQFVFQTKD